jgi:hypothetical protein
MQQNERGEPFKEFLCVSDKGIIQVSDKKKTHNKHHVSVPTDVWLFCQENHRNTAALVNAVTPRTARLRQAGPPGFVVRRTK